MSIPTFFLLGILGDQGLPREREAATIPAAPMAASPDEITASEIGRRLRAARALAGLSQEDAAQQAGITVRTLRNWEQGVSAATAPGVAALVSVYRATAPQVTCEEVLLGSAPELTAGTWIVDQRLLDRIASVDSEEDAAPLRDEIEWTPPLFLVGFEIPEGARLTNRVDLERMSAAAAERIRTVAPALHRAWLASVRKATEPT